MPEKLVSEIVVVVDVVVGVTTICAFGTITP